MFTELGLAFVVVTAALLVVSGIGFAVLLVFARDQADEDRAERQAYAEYRERQRRDQGAA